MMPLHGLWVNSDTPTPAVPLRTYRANRGFRVILFWSHTSLLCPSFSWAVALNLLPESLSCGFFGIKTDL